MTFTEVLLRKGIKFRISGSDRGKCSVCCPFCTERGKERDTQFRLCVHVTQLWGKCLHCEWSHRYAVAPVLKQLGIIATNVTGAEHAEDPHVEPVVLPKDFQILTRVYDDLDIQARDYILKRGVTKEQIRECTIGVSYIGKYAYRILFPIYVGEELRGINARDFTGQGIPKYLLSRGDKFLYRFDPQRKTVVFSEGVIKALRIQQVVDFGSSALLGHDLTEQQWQQLRESACEHVILYPDLDPVGKRGVTHIADKLLESWKGKVSVVWPVRLPADELPLEELKAVMAGNVVPYTQALRRKMTLKK